MRALRRDEASIGIGAGGGLGRLRATDGLLHNLGQ
jgi:hypothetical protein